MTCSSRIVPSVAVTSACVSPRLKIDEPCVRGRTPTSMPRSRTWFMARLKQIQSPLIREVRGLGLMVGIELKQKVTPYLQALMAQGVLALPAGLTVMRFLPPLVVSQEQLATVAQTVDIVLRQPISEQ